jgi:hypothetical protein
MRTSVGMWGRRKQGKHEPTPAGPIAIKEVAS